MRRLPLALVVGLLAAALPLSASAAGPDLRSELPPPPGANWNEETVGTAGEGTMTVDDVAATNRNPAHARSVLGTADFKTGYRRIWTDASTHTTLVERDYLFGNAFGAGLWLGTIKGGDERAADWQQTYDTSSIPNSFGGYRLTNGSYNTVVEFAPGDRVYAVSITSPNGQAKELALGQAQQMQSTAPVEVFSGDGAAAFGRVMAIGGIVLLLVLAAAGVVIFFAVRSSRHRPQAVPATMYSPDGRWWWDGRQWQPVRPPPPTPPAFPSP